MRYSSSTTAHNPGYCLSEMFKQCDVKGCEMFKRLGNCDRCEAAVVEAMSLFERSRKNGK